MSHIFHTYTFFSVSLCWQSPTCTTFSGDLFSKCFMRVVGKNCLERDLVKILLKHGESTNTQQDPGTPGTLLRGWIANPIIQFVIFGGSLFLSCFFSAAAAFLECCTNSRVLGQHFFCPTAAATSNTAFCFEKDCVYFFLLLARIKRMLEWKSIPSSEKKLPRKING